MAKDVKSLDDLLLLVRKELAKFPEFEGVRPLAAYWHEPDDGGANWDIQNWRGDEETVKQAWKAIAPAVRALRAKFDAPTPD